MNNPPRLNKLRSFNENGIFIRPSTLHKFHAGLAGGSAGLDIIPVAPPTVSWAPANARDARDHVDAVLNDW